jgi:Flp pilus assembly pilin Flp
MVAFSRVLKRQAGATARELVVIAGLVAFSLASMMGVVGYSVYATSMAISHR